MKNCPSAVAVKTRVAQFCAGGGGGGGGTPPGGLFILLLCVRCVARVNHQAHNTCSSDRPAPSTATCRCLAPSGSSSRRMPDSRYFESVAGTSGLQYVLSKRIAHLMDSGAVIRMQARFEWCSIEVTRPSQRPQCCRPKIFNAQAEW